MPLCIDGDHFTYDNTLMKKELGIQPTHFASTQQTTIDYYAQLHWPEPTFGMPKQKDRN